MSTSSMKKKKKKKNFLKLIFDLVKVLKNSITMVYNNNK